MLDKLWSVLLYQGGQQKCPQDYHLRLITLSLSVCNLDADINSLALGVSLCLPFCSPARTGSRTWRSLPQAWCEPTESAVILLVTCSRGIRNSSMLETDEGQDGSLRVSLLSCSCCNNFWMLCDVQLESFTLCRVLVLVRDTLLDW